MALQKKYLTKEEALQKAKQYCAYQERSHHDVVQKLWDLGVRKAEHDEIISALIEEDYLNEERFAVQYAGGKFRMKDWGRKKIYYGLKEKQVSAYCISKALKSINEDDYRKTLQQENNGLPAAKRLRAGTGGRCAGRHGKRRLNFFKSPCLLIRTAVDQQPYSNRSSNSSFPFQSFT
jgi:regulatory protein